MALGFGVYFGAVAALCFERRIECPVMLAVVIDVLRWFLSRNITRS